MVGVEHIEADYLLSRTRSIEDAIADALAAAAAAGTEETAADAAPAVAMAPPRLPKPSPARARELKDRSRRMPGRMTGSPPPSPTRGYEPSLEEGSLSRRV